MDAAYVRVSSKDQNEGRQVEKMLELGIDERRIFIEKASGKDFDRPIYQSMKMSGALREGDVLYIDSIDRLGRTYEGIKEEWVELTRKMKVDVVALDMPDLFDSRKFRAMGDHGVLMEDQMLSLLAWVAEQERKKIKTRQKEGIELAKAAGKYKGRKPVEVDTFEFARLLAEVRNGERTNKYVMDKLNLTRTTYYQLIKEYDNKTGRFKI